MPPRIAMFHSVFVVLALSACLSACDLPAEQQRAQTAESKLDQKFIQLESRVENLQHTQVKLAESQQSQNGDWVLWSQAEGINAGYPVAQSAFPTKEACLESASQWSIPGGQVVSRDPYIIRNKSGGWIYRCLPHGTDPLARR
jgi:hypothetical protein